MTVEKEKVKSGKEVVGIVETPRFESIEEAISASFAGKPALGQDGVLKLINSQYATNIKNDFRAQFNREPSEAKRLEQAREELLAKLNSADGQQELISIAGQPGGTDKWVADRSVALLAEWSKKRSAAAAAVAEQEAADENEEQNAAETTTTA